MARVPLILASASPRRHRLLASLERPFEIQAADLDEELGDGELTEEVARLAERKAEAISQRRPTAAVLGADTVVEVAGQVLGKPVDDEDARRMLRLCSGREQRVHTGVALLCPSMDLRRRATRTTVVVFRPLSEDEIEAYVRSGAPRGKAGAYAIQEGADRFVVRLEGAFDNVVGLPVDLVARWLEELDAVLG